MTTPCCYREHFLCVTYSVLKTVQVFFSRLSFHLSSFKCMYISRYICMFMTTKKQSSFNMSKGHHVYTSMSFILMLQLMSQLLREAMCHATCTWIGICCLYHLYFLIWLFALKPVGCLPNHIALLVQSAK